MSTQAQAQEADILALPSGDNKLEYPLLKPDKIYRFTIKSAELVDAKSDKAPEGGQNLTIKLATSKDEMSTKDEVLHAGYVITKYIPTYAIEKRGMQRVKDDLDTINQAVFGKSTKLSARDLLNDPSKIVGKPIDGKVGINVDKSGQFSDSNTVRFIVPE